MLPPHRVSRLWCRRTDGRHGIASPSPYAPRSPIVSHALGSDAEVAITGLVTVRPVGNWFARRSDRRGPVTADQPTWATSPGDNGSGRSGQLSARAAFLRLPTDGTLRGFVHVRTPMNGWLKRVIRCSCRRFGPQRGSGIPWLLPPDRLTAELPELQVGRFRRGPGPRQFPERAIGGDSSGRIDKGSARGLTAQFEIVSSNAARNSNRVAPGQRLDPPLQRRQLRKDLTVCESGRDEHDVARTFARCAIGDAQVPVQRVARLREHCGSLSRGAGRISSHATARGLEPRRRYADK
jgi:hypothetical protein